MSILNQYTKEKHRLVESHPFVQYLLTGDIKPEHYALFLQQMYVVYSAIEYYAEISLILTDMQGIKRSESIRQDILELGYDVNDKPLPATEKYRQRIVDLYYGDMKRYILAHVYVRHMGDLYGGKVIAKRVPGSGKMYQFDDRPGLIRTLDSKLSLDIVEEALLGFDLASGIFDDLMEKINERN
jgi:heme oxygenase